MFVSYPALIWNILVANLAQNQGYYNIRTQVFKLIIDSGLRTLGMVYLLGYAPMF
jgi:hypothetical protein